MREKQSVTRERVEFIRANPQLTITEMSNALGVSRDLVAAHCLYHGLPFKSAIKVAAYRTRESEFFNVHSHSDWMVGKY